MPEIYLRDGEPFDVALRRFKRAVEKSGNPSKLREKEAYEKPTTERKRKKAAAKKRYQKKLQKEREAMMRGHAHSRGRKEERA